MGCLELKSGMKRQRHTLDDLESRRVSGVELLLLGNLCPKTLADALGDGRAIELGGNHCGG